jgi:hydrogenase expression/formation protein HypC
MCLTRPAQVVAVEGARARVQWPSQALTVDAGLVGPLWPGDYVLVHAGVALERIDAEEAAALEAVLAEWDSAVDLLPDSSVRESQASSDGLRQAASSPDCRRREQQ